MYLMLNFCFWYGSKVLFDVSRDMSKKLHLVVPISIVFLSPSSLNVFIVFFFNLYSSWSQNYDKNSLWQQSFLGI